MIPKPIINYKEIFEAWKISLNPTARHEELAKLRLGVCLGCEHKKEIIKGLRWSAYCGDCGCPLSKKIFSATYNACGLKKWAEVDSNYLEPVETKNNPTII